MITIEDTFKDFFGTPDEPECAYCGGESGELIVSARDDMTGEPTLWHHAECQKKKDAETGARIKEMNRRIAEQAARDEYEEK